ncbi:MAG: ATP-binding protein [Chloroflexota bacterium]|nr:ATP-binding protein [Chloroflexota bacterium]
MPEEKENVELVVTTLEPSLTSQLPSDQNALPAHDAEIAVRDQEIALLRRQLEDERAEKTYKIALALTLANAAYDAVFVLDEQYKIIAINDPAETLFEVVRPIGEHIAAVTGAPELEMMVTDALDNREEIFEEQITLNKRVYRVRVQVIPRDGNWFTALTLQDISELVRLNRARRDMVTNISHELRRPITNIRLIIEGLFHEQDKPKRKQSTSAVKAIGRETDLLQWIVQEMFDLSMIESGQAIMRMIELSARELLDEAVERLIDHSDAKDLRVNIETPELLQVLADRDQARRVLVNLLHNAIKWSPPGELITLRAQTDDTDVIFSVFDNGPGVADDQRERIFERFYQVDAARTSSDGTGLGLAICRHIVRAHGGRIWADGNVDAEGQKRGGRFFFTLPTP